MKASAYTTLGTGGALRAQAIYSPVLTLLSALVIAPFLAHLVVAPLLSQPSVPSDYHSYRLNEWLDRGTIALVVFATICLTTWLLSKLEGVSQTILLAHLRQCSLIYVYVIFSIMVAMQDIQCYVCPTPWTSIAVPAVLANALVLLLLARHEVAA